MVFDDGSFVRVRMNESEVRALISVTDKIKPGEISNFKGERQGLHTIMAKLDKAIKKLERPKDE